MKKVLKKISLRNASEFLQESELKKVLGGKPDVCEGSQFCGTLPCMVMDYSTGGWLDSRCSKDCECVADFY